MRFLYLPLVLLFFTHCARQETNSASVGSAKIIEDNTEEWFFNGISINNRSPNTFNNIYSEFITNENFITINDLEFRIEKLYLDDNISPIGWSKNGQFAYAQYIPHPYG